MAPARRNGLVKALAFGAAGWMATSMLGGSRERSFTLAGPAVPKRPFNSRVGMNNFKEDFEAWRSSLTPEERDLLQEQAMGEYNKAYRKSENFKKNIPDEKVKAFGQILSKFFENESEEYEKQQKAAVPDYEGLFKVAGDKWTVDFSLKNRIVTIDRDADRRYDYVSRRIWESEQKGEWFPQSSPLQEKWRVRNNDTESHEKNLKTLKFIEMAANDPGCTDQKVKEQLLEASKMEIPPVGEPFELLIPEHLAQQILTLRVWMLQFLTTTRANFTQEELSDAEIDEYAAGDEFRGTYATMVKWMQENYFKTRDEVQDAADFTKAFFRSQADRKEELKSKTKADIMKEIWAILPKVSDKPVPPLDEEMLAELAEEPAIADGEFMHSWGTADKLYKSEAIDAFGEEFLLGVYETQEEAAKAFEDWNKAYEAAREVRAGEMDQWYKQEMARLERSKGPGTDRIAEMLEEARGR